VGLAFLMLVGGLVLRQVVVRLLGRRLLTLAEHTETEADDIAIKAIVGPLGVLILLGAAFAAFRLLAAGFFADLQNSARVFRVLTTVVVAWALFRLVDAAALILLDFARRTDNDLDDQLVPLLRKAGKLLVTAMAFLLAIQNLGYSVGGLLAGLGIGGLAFALAAKDTIANLFGGVTILVDRPFKVGHWITFDDTSGVVEEIGLRSSRIRTFAKTQVSVPNQALANATIENHSLMPKRRVKMSVGVTYATTPAQMRSLVERVETLLKNHPGVHQEFMLVKFTEFGASSLDLFVYYFSATTDWADHLQVKQELNLAIMETVEEMGLSIAFPTRTVHLVQEDRA
jgi:MscS family membrane protein